MDNGTFDNYDRIGGELDETANVFANKVFNPKLAALRAQNPFLTILPFPNGGVCVQLQANTPMDIVFPQEVKMVRFKGQGDYFVNRNGNAFVPSSTQTQGGQLYKPEDFFFWVEEIQGVSVIAPANAYLSIEFFTQL